MKCILTKDVLFLIDLLDNKARVVGGAVRDALQGSAINDIDIATELTPADVLSRLTTAKIRTMTTGIEHGTIMAIVNHKPYEITTLRTDIETDGRHAKVSFTNSYEQDAKRRDFTINSLYMDKNGVIYDYTNGQNDLKHHYVRFIGSASERVQEDYLRILRYFRFWSKLGHGPINEEAITACTTYANKLNTISSERKRYEFFAILLLPNCDKTLSLMQQTNVLRYILPTANISNLSHLLKVYPHADIEEKLAVLTQGDPIHLTLSKTQKKLLSCFNQNVYISDDLTTEKLNLFHLGKRVYHFHVYQALIRKNISKKTAKTLLSLETPIFPIRGQDFIDLGYPHGPQIQECLKIAETIWANNGFSQNKNLVLKQFLMYNGKKG
ncbi:MAG: CCA tRNA nucleotidyltransferase [Alphaproteobacteria bacterium]|nr:CCA tRNA nucleotidyltransferase [Alphaproteobacteria bacterium]